MRRKRDARRWVRHAIGGAAAAAALRGAPAHAACSGSGLHTVSVGVHLGIAFGGTGWPVKLNYGFTGRFGESTAAFARLEGFGISALQFTGGLTQTIGNSVFAEGGGMAAVGQPGLSGAGFHLAIGPGDRGGGVIFGSSLPLVGDRALWNFQISPFVYPSEVCFPSGRALRVGEGVALPPLLARTDCARADDALASAWLDDARAELASVPSFLRLAEELGALGAPGWLRRAALVAADEERDHAMAAFAMASRWAGSAFAVAPLDAPPRFDHPSPSALAQLAIEAWQDGCLGEGTAALCARDGLTRVRDEQAERVLARIAPDEERHAELSWSILEWCCLVGGSAVRHSVAEVALRSASIPAEAAGEDEEWLSWNGRLTSQERNAIRARVEEQAGAKLARTLAGA